MKNNIKEMRTALQNLLQVADGVPMMGQEATKRIEHARKILTKITIQ